MKTNNPSGPGIETNNPSEPGIETNNPSEPGMETNNPSGPGTTTPRESDSALISQSHLIKMNIAGRGELNGLDDKDVDEPRAAMAAAASSSSSSPYDDDFVASVPNLKEEQHKLVVELEEDAEQQQQQHHHRHARPPKHGQQHHHQQQCRPGNSSPQSLQMGGSDEGNNARQSCSVGADSSERGPKTAKFLSFLEQFTLSTMFRIFGRFVGTYPFAFLISSLILASLSVGMYKLELRDRVRDGYTPSTSLSRYETDVLKEFLGSSGDPLLTTVMLRARDGHSMHRLRWLGECVQLHDFLRRNISAKFEQDEPVLYSDICGPFCDANMAINYFRDSLASQLALVKSGGRPSASLNLTYPIARVNGFELHLERNFYGVRTKNDERNRAKDAALMNDDPEVAELDALTDIRHIEAVMMTFRADISHPQDEAKMAHWEMRVYEFSRQFNNSMIEMLVLGSEIVDREMAAEAERTVPYFVMGFFFMFGFAVYTLLIGAFIYGVMDWAKPLLALGICLCPVLSVTSTFGVCTIAGHRTNSLMLIMPFLICGIGVNDAFLMTHSWNRLARQKLAAPRRIGLVFEEVGPSITITTLTNVVTFAIGALTPTPEISVFCMATAVALGFAYIYTLMLFAPLICFANVVEDRKLKRDGSSTSKWVRNARVKLNSAFSRISDAYCDLLTSRLFGSMLLVGVLVYWYFALTGTLNINAKLDTEKILPRNSPLLEPHQLISHMVWTEFYPLTILVNNPVDIRSSRQLARLNAMLDDFEGLKLCKGKQFTIFWLREYAEYFEMARQYDFDYFATDNSTEEADVDAVEATPRSETGLDYSRLEQFLSSPFHKHFLPFLKFSPSIKRPITGLEQHTPVAKFSVLVTFHNTSDWQNRIELMQEWRAVAKRYADLNVTIWEANGMFVDQMLSLKTLTLQTTFLTLACMALVCAIFIQNPLSVITASCAIGSISIGVIGFLSWWNLHLDPVTLSAVLMSIGMSVDFTAHTAYSFQLSHKREIRDGRIVQVPLRLARDKLQHVLRSIAWPMSQAGLSTVICVLPLVFLQNYIPLVFVKTISLVAIWGLFHGLVLMPAFLASLPPRWLELNCYRMAVQRIQQMGDQQHLDDANDWDGALSGSGGGGGCSNTLLPSTDAQQQKMHVHDEADQQKGKRTALEPFRLSYLLKSAARQKRSSTPLAEKGKDEDEKQSANQSTAES
uniref:SSD domain-containing protein n=1 Tax=Globodera pallida TaxID=36090 RepID=A0A183C6X1_GLOPA